MCGGTDFLNQVRNPLDLDNDVIHRLTRGAHQLASAFHAAHTGADERLDFFGCVGGAPCQAADFAGYHCKATALLPGAGCFYRRV